MLVIESPALNRLLTTSGGGDMNVTYDEEDI
jgi:hypothetical protein